ncbi:phosphodiesterase [Rhodococcus sp. GG48]|nr:phosphodiesterase [Rhodococcus sp. GG48]
MDGLRKAVSVPFEVGSAVRGARIFHPHGVLFEGIAEFDTGDAGRGRWPLPTGEPVPLHARLSRGIGLPGLLPDILGVAVRLRLPGGPWDLLLASAFVPARIALAPARSWASANFSTLAAYRGIDGAAPRWIVAAPVGGRPDGPPSLEDLVPPLSFRVGLASARGAPVPVGSFRLTRRIPCEDGDQPSFDPVLNCPAGIRMWPSWLAGIRRIAYAGSRRGRGTDATRTCTPVEDAIT